MVIKYIKNLIIILLISDLSFSEWVLNFSDQFDENSSKLTLWKRSNETQWRKNNVKGGE